MPHNQFHPESFEDEPSSIMVEQELNDLRVIGSQLLCLRIKNAKTAIHVLRLRNWVVLRP